MKEYLFEVEWADLTAKLETYESMSSVAQACLRAVCFKMWIAGVLARNTCKSAADLTTLNESMVKETQFMIQTDNLLQAQVQGGVQ